MPKSNFESIQLAKTQREREREREREAVLIVVEAKYHTHCTERHSSLIEVPLIDLDTMKQVTQFRLLQTEGEREKERELDEEKGCSSSTFYFSPFEWNSVTYK